MVDRQARKRTLTILGSFVVIALLIGGKLFSVQVVNGESYRERAAGQYIAPRSDFFDRGSIYFQSKDGDRVSAATLKTGYRVAIVPERIEDPEALYEDLSQYLVELDREEFFKKATKADDPYEEIARRVPDDVASNIRKLGYGQVHTIKEQWRYYPAGDVGASVIGFTAYDDDELVGRYGLEAYYEESLHRTPPELYVNFFAEVFAGLSQTLASNKEKEGDVMTTIEPSVQLFLHNHLVDLKERWNAQDAGGIIMNPRTGAIYAMASVPSFDLNEFSEVEDISIYRNPLVSSVFEMGSVFKPIIMSIGLETDSVRANTPFYDEGYVEVGDVTIRNFDRIGRGDVVMQDVLNQSLNTGMVYIGQQVGKKQLREYLERFEIGERTGIDLPNETKGLVSNLDSNRDVEYANISFGQGIAMTPIKLAQMFAALGNGGKLVTPHVVESVRYAYGIEKEIKYDEPKQVLDPETSEEITRMLVELVDTTNDGAIKLEHHSIAAKTGTAQIPRPGGGYYDDRNLHSLIGYFPAYDPEFVLYLYTTHPKGVQYAAQSLMDPFLDTAKFLLNYHDTHPDR